MPQQPPPSHTTSPRDTILDSSLTGALYVARCRDSGLTPSQSGARRFSAEVAAVQPNAERDNPNTPAMKFAGPRAVNLPGLRLGPRSAQLLARGAHKCTALHLRGNTALVDDGATTLLPLLEMGTLRSIDLGNCGLGARFAPALARFLLRTPNCGSTLERLELGGPSASPLQRPNQLRGVAALSAVLQQKCPRLTSLGLSHSALGTTDECEAAVQGLTALAVHCSNLSALDLSHNAFGYRHGGPLLQLLPVLCPNLIELDLSGNELSDPGAETLSFALLSGTAGGEDAHRHINTLSGAASTIAQAKLADPKARAVLRKWKCSLRSLSLNSNHIRVRGTRALAIAAARSPSLRYLSLADNPIGDDGAAALAAALAPETQPVIETVAPTWDRSAAMELLDLGDAVGTTNQPLLASLAAAGYQPPSSKHSSQADGGEEEDVSAAESTPRTAPPPATASVAASAAATWSKLESLNVSGCSIGPSGALELSRVALAGRLLTLRSARNVLSEEGFASLADAINSDTSKLSVLDLSGCRLTDRSALVLVEAIADRSTQPKPALKSLQLHDNALSDEGGKAMLAELKSTGNGGGLHSLTTHGNKLCHGTTSALKELCVANRQALAVPKAMEMGLAELAPCPVELHRLEHMLRAEKAQNTIAQMALSQVERQLAEVRKEQAELMKGAGEAHAASEYEEEDTKAQLASMSEAYQFEQREYEAERDELQAELNKLLLKRYQIERIGKERNPSKIPSGWGFVELPEEITAEAADAEYNQLKEKEEELLEILLLQTHREKEAHATRMWCEEQLNDIARVVANAKAKAPAKKK